ncbi:MAG: glycosyltransferase [Bacteroidota bacterium]
MLKILHINTFSWGGAAKAGIRLHEALLRYGVSSKILFLEQNDYNIPESYDFKGHLSKQNITKKLRQKLKEKYVTHRQLQKLKSIGGDPNLFKFSQTPYRVLDHPLFQWADIVHLHWVSDLINPITFFQNIQQPVFWTFHDLQAVSGGYHYNCGIDKEQYSKLIARNQFINKKSIAKQRIHVICPSQWMLKSVENSELLENAQCFHLPYGVDTDIFSPLSQETARTILGLAVESKIALFAAGNLFDPRKGLIDLLAAFAQLKDENIQLAVVGNKYQKQLPENVHYLGNMKDERLMRVAYAAANITVLPSLADNLPNTALESLLCGTPILANRVGGLVEIVNEQNGSLCDTQNIDEFAQQLVAILNKGFNNHLILQAAVKKYGNASQIESIIPLYERVLAKV